MSIAPASSTARASTPRQYGCVRWLSATGACAALAAQDTDLGNVGGMASRGITSAGAVSARRSGNGITVVSALGPRRQTFKEQGCPRQPGST